MKKPIDRAETQRRKGGFAAWLKSVCSERGMESSVRVSLLLIIATSCLTWIMATDQKRDLGWGLVSIEGTAITAVLGIKYFQKRIEKASLSASAPPRETPSPAAA